MRRLVPLAVVVALLAGGCGGPPPLHPVTGKVTLGGKSYERLIIYFRPVSGEADMYTLGVGETDKDGAFKGVKCSAGVGLAAGEYKVSFTCMQPKGGKKVAAGEKPDDTVGVVMQELVPASHADAGGTGTSPVTFTVKVGENAFTFDIPAK